MKQIKRHTLQVSPEIYEQLMKLKGSRTWNKLFKEWVAHFRGEIEWAKKDIVRHMTYEEWDDLMKRLKDLEALKDSITE